MNERQIRWLIILGGLALAVLAQYLFGDSSDLPQRIIDIVTGAIGGGAAASQLVKRVGD